MKSHKENCQKLYEDNYRKLVTMLPDLAFVEHVTLSSDDHMLTVAIDVIERTKYTVLLELNTFYKGNIACILQPKMQLRMYHDAEVAEVVMVQGKRHIRPYYQYPNEAMYLPDEKKQCNKILFEVLSFCGRNKYKKTYLSDPTEIN